MTKPKKRKCELCHKEKELKDFWGDATMPLGKMYKCKECCKLSEKYKARRSKASKNWRLRNLLKVKAHSMVHNSLKWGYILKPEKCQDCGEERKLHAHHDNYEKPLVIKWLCDSCHKLTHRRFCADPQAF